MARPQTITHTSTAKPCRSTRETQPEKMPPSTAPIGMPANSSANASPPPSGPPKLTWAISGNSARGIPKTIAMMSTRKDISSTECPARYRNPSITALMPSVPVVPSIGSGGRKNTAPSVGSSDTVSIR